MSNATQDLRNARRTAIVGMFDFACRQVALALTVAEQRHAGRCVAVIDGRQNTYAMVHSLSELHHVEALPNGNPDYTNVYPVDAEGMELQTVVKATDELREWLLDPRFRILTGAEVSQLDEIHRRGPVRTASLASAPQPDIEGLQASWSTRGQACRAVLVDQLAVLREALLKAEAEQGQRVVAPAGPYWLSGDSKILVVGNQLASGTLEMDNPCDTEFDRVGDETILSLSTDLDGEGSQSIRPMTAKELEDAAKSDVY